MDENDDWELDFSKYTFDFVKCLSDFHKTKRFCDAAIQISGKRVSFHRAILAASCTYFCDLLRETCELDSIDPKSRKVDTKLDESQLKDDLENLLSYVYACGNHEAYDKQYSMTFIQSGPKLMKELDRMRLRGEFCDVLLKLNDDVFPAHRVVLAAGSPYFFSLFTSNMKEKRQSVVEIIIPELSVTHDMMRYIYTGSVLISDANAYELWIAADYLLLEELKHQCYLFLESTLSESNCLYIHFFAKIYGLNQLQNISRQFSEENFNAVVKTEDFLQLTADELDALTSSDSLRVANEEMVYESLKSWCNHNVTKRNNDFQRIFVRNVRLSLVDSKYIRKHLLKDGLIVSNENCIRKVQQVLMDLTSKEKPRTGYSSFYVFSLQRDCRDSEVKFFCYDILHGACLELEPPSDTPLCTDTIELASCYGKVYTVDSNGNCFCFEPQSSRWSQLSSVPDTVPSIFSPTRWGHGLASLDGFLYLCGGNTTLGEPDGLTLRYDCIANTWEMIASLCYPRCGTCAVACGHYLYAIGGEGRMLRPCVNVEKYIPSKDTWIEVSPMISPKGGKPKGIAARDKIFVCMENICELNGCEIYNTATDQWQIVASPRAHKFNAPLGFDGSSVYVLGGSACSKHSLSYLTQLYSIVKVQVLNMNTYQWSHHGTAFTTGYPINSCLMQVHKGLGPSEQSSCCIL